MGKKWGPGARHNLRRDGTGGEGMMGGDDGMEGWPAAQRKKQEPRAPPRMPTWPCGKTQPNVRAYIL